MSLIQKIARFEKISLQSLVRLYPPFVFMGLKVSHLSKDDHHMIVELPLRWYFKNLNGTMFGGFIAAASDPLAALMCGRILRRSLGQIEVWTQKHTVEFLRPAKSTIQLEIKISNEAIETILKDLDSKGKCLYTFEKTFIQKKDQKEIARVTTTVYFRKIVPKN